MSSLLGLPKSYVESQYRLKIFVFISQVLQGQVKLEDEKQATLKKKASINVEGTEHEITFEMLCSKVLSTYLRCGLDPDPSLGSLQMLTMIEVFICAQQTPLLLNIFDSSDL